MKEQGFKYEFDETDHLAKHMLLFEDDIPVATCRFFFSDLGGKRIELSAQCRVAEFYKKQGYMELNDIHMDEDCPHTWMRKEV